MLASIKATVKVYSKAADTLAEKIFESTLKILFINDFCVFIHIPQIIVHGVSQLSIEGFS